MLSGKDAAQTNTHPEYQTIRKYIEQLTPIITDELNRGAHDKALHHLQKGIKKFQRIPENQCTVSERCLLGEYYFFASVCSKTSEKKSFLLQSIATILYIPYEQLPAPNLRTLAQSYCQMSLHVNAAERLSWLNKAVNAIQQIPKTERTPQDRKTLSNYFHYAAAASSDLPQKRSYHEKALACYQEIPTAERCEADWKAIASRLFSVASVCLDSYEWLKAKSCFADFFDSQLQFIEKTKTDFKAIEEAFESQANLFMSGTIGRQLYLFGCKLFSEHPIPTAKIDFYRLYHTILHASSTRTAADMRGLMQMMRMIEKFVAHPEFPNKDVKQWLSEMNQQRAFIKMLQDIQTIYQPLSLLDAATQAPSLQVALASRLSLLEVVTSQLTEEVAALTNENQQLKWMLTGRTSKYEGTMTMFAKSDGACPRTESAEEKEKDEMRCH